MKQYMTSGSDGKQIFVTLMDDVKDPKGVIQIIHGMAEYAARFEPLAKYLNEQGYIVFMDDHRAHGRTETDETRSSCPGNIFRDTVADEVLFYNQLKDKYQLPVFVLGHSYGSFIAQAFAQEGTDCRAIGLIGTANMGKFVPGLGAFLLWPLHVICPHHKFKLANRASSAFFRYKGDKGKSQWVVKDMESRQNFLDDPMTGIDMSVNFDYYMLKELPKLYGKKAKNKLKPTCPIGMFCGTDDPIGGKGKLVVKLNKFYSSIGIPTEMHLYEGIRHEVHNDVDRETAWKDIVSFFNKYVLYKQTTIDDLLKNED